MIKHFYGFDYALGGIISITGKDLKEQWFSKLLGLGI